MGGEELPKGVRVEVRLYIARGRILVAGEGLVRILEAIEEAGSLRAAARRLGMNYRKLWTKINRAETLLGFKLVVGRGRRGSRLTSEARALLREYNRVRGAVESCILRTNK